MRSHTLVGSIVLLIAAAGCGKLKAAGGELGAGDTGTSAAGTSASSASGAGASSDSTSKFAGTYRSNWGETTFSAEGGRVKAKYPRGTIDCAVSGDNLACDWHEGSMTGKAALTRQANGDITGTWGNGSSSTNGGPWNFTAPAGAAPGKSAGGAATFAGTYKSTWGPTTFVQDGSRVTARYPRGNMTCTASGNVLDCGWTEGSMSGKARLTKQSNGAITGTWGNGASATNGGPWTFSPT